jgi:predicted Zn finger-like uncharacterized protein
MAEEKFTRCPSCKTIYRVTSAQLAMRAGQVRCGHCHAVFDGVAQLLSLAPKPREEPEFDEEALGPPTVTLRNEHALEPAPRADERGEADGESAVDTAFAETEPSDAEANYAARFAWQEKKTRRVVPGWLYAASVPVLLIALAAQALFHYHDAVAAWWPATKPALIRFCAAAGCEVRPLRDRDPLVVEGSELQADPAHRGLLILTATIRNHAPYPLAYPHLELTLTDVQRQTQQDIVVVRRVFTPQEYLSGTVDLASGIPGNGELNIKLFIDASATTQAGYQVYAFYP